MLNCGGLDAILSKNRLIQPPKRQLYNEISLVGDRASSNRGYFYFFILWVVTFLVTKIPDAPCIQAKRLHLKKRFVRDPKKIQPRYQSFFLVK